MKDWLTLIAGAVRRAQTEGHLRADADAAQLAFELHSIAMGANWAFQLFGDVGAFHRARVAFDSRLEPLGLAASGNRGSRRRSKDIR